MKTVLSPGGRRYNAAPMPRDHRDFSVSRLTIASTSATEVMLDDDLGPVRDQGDEGSCTGNAAAGDNDFQLRVYDPRFKDNPKTAPVTSVQFIYRMSRVMDGTQDSDSGSDGRTTCKVLQKYGACTDASWPYVAGDIYRDPTPEQFAEALKYKSGAYHFAYTVDDIKSVLASKYCLRLGFAVYDSFENTTGTSGVYTPNISKESLEGYHENLIKGFSDSKYGGAFSVRNSWGASWGLKGDFWLPYTVAADKNIFSDAVVQHFGKPWIPKSAGS
jgi:hypothetical protein